MWKVLKAIWYVLNCLLSFYLTCLQQCNTLDRNPIFYSFSRLIAIAANTNAHIYAREEQVLAVKMIVLEEWVCNVYKNLNEDSEQHLACVVAWTAIFGRILL